jgi:hypothetical protein
MLKKFYEKSPVKSDLLVFFEKFNGAPIAGFPFHYNKQRAEAKICIFGFLYLFQNLLNCFQ